VMGHVGVNSLPQRAGWSEGDRNAG
jgi:hypothetical protein